MTEPEDRVKRPMRAVVLWAYAALCVLLVLAVVAAVAVLIDNARAEAARVCRARIAAHAEGIRDARDTAVAEGLASAVIERQPIDARAKAQQIRDLGRALESAADLRRRADDICAADSSYTP